MKVSEIEMSREKQIEEMRSIIETDCEFVCDECDFNGKEHCFIHYCSNALYNADYRKQEWISVEERLPEENGRYLACVNVSHLAFTSLTIITVMEYGKNHGFYLYSEDEPVTHWMPLPEAPKMKGGAE